MKTGGLLSPDTEHINKWFDEQQIVDHQYRTVSFVIYRDSHRKYRYAFTELTYANALKPFIGATSPDRAITLIPVIIITKRVEPRVCSPVKKKRTFGNRKVSSSM